MQYNYKGTYSATTAYSVQDVVSYQPTSSDPIKYYFCLTANTGQTPSPSADTNYWAIINALSNFPNAVDTFLSHTSLQSSDTTDLNRFQTLSLQSSLTPDEQTELSNLTQKLRNKLITSDDFNSLQASISNMQQYLKDSVEGYIDQKQSEFDAQIAKFADKGDYLSTTTYMKNNFVTYQSQTYLCTVDNTINILPTNTSNWRLAAKQGAQGIQGQPGLNLVFIGTYDPTVTYSTGNAVSYNGSVYYATKSSVGETPQSNGVSWTIFMARAGITVSPTPPSSPTDQQVWVDTTNNLFKYYVASSSSWVIVGGSTVSYATNTSATDDYTVSVSGITTYSAGMVVNFVATVANTTACTLNVNSLGAKNIFKNVSSSLETGDIITNQVVSVIYDGTNFQLLSIPGSVTTAQSTQTFSNKTFTAPKIATGGYISDENGNKQIVFTTTANAVNNLNIKNSATGTAPQIQAQGNDTNIDINLVPKGTGQVKSNGTAVVLATQIGANSGVASLDSTGNVPKSQLGNVPPSNLLTNPNFWIG